MNTLHIVETKYTSGPNVSRDEIFQVLVKHEAQEDARGYLALMAHALNNLMTTDWRPADDFLEALSLEEKKRAGYLFEFAWTKMLENSEKKQWVRKTAACLKDQVVGTPMARLFPKFESSFSKVDGRHNDTLAMEWGFEDGVLRENILKVLNL